MPNMFNLITLFTLFLLIFACNKRVSDVTGELPPGQQIEVQTFGESNTLEIASWNIEFFPKNNSETIESVKEIIRDLDIDIFAVQEIVDVDAFNQLLDSLPDYEGLVGTGAASFAQWPGIIYRQSLVTVLEEKYLFQNESYIFPRAPYSLKLRASKNNISFDFNLIILHLKAFGDGTSENRRRLAIDSLETYITKQLQNPQNDPDFIVAGDWNDLLDDQGGSNVFQPFLNQPQQYRFLTESFAGNDFTYIGGSFESLLDHIMVTASIDAFFPNINTQILKLDLEFAKYEMNVSDHRPVAAKIPVF